MRSWNHSPFWRLSMSGVWPTQVSPLAAQRTAKIPARTFFSR